MLHGYDMLPSRISAIFGLSKEMLRKGPQGVTGFRLSKADDA